MSKKPTKFDQVIADELLARISGGETTTSVCLDVNMPSMQTLYRWKACQNGAPSSFSEDYSRARLMQADSLATEIIDIADNADEFSVTSGQLAVANLNEYSTPTEIRRAKFYAQKRSIEASKMMIDTRKWAAARMAPHNWGEKVTHEITGGVDVTQKIDFTQVSTEQLERMATMEKELRAPKEELPEKVEPVALLGTGT